MSVGKKFDSGKLRWRLVPWQQFREVVEVLNIGADKYGEHNWIYVPDAKNRYFDALMRHVMAWASGETNDPEDGKSHLAHAICCLLFIMWMEKDHG